MNLSFTILRNTPNFIYGEFATNKSQVKSYGTAILQLRNLLTDHHIKRLTP
jgi:hypothetical protein